MTRDGELLVLRGLRVLMELVCLKRTLGRRENRIWDDWRVDAKKHIEDLEEMNSRGGA